MRIIILGLSGCLGACVGTIPVTTHNHLSYAADIADTDPVDTDSWFTASNVVVEETLSSTDDAALPLTGKPSSSTFKSGSGSELFRISAGVPGVARDKDEDTSTAVSYGQEDDESVFVSTSYKGGNLFTMGTSFTTRKQVGDFDMPLEEDRGFWHMKMSSAASGEGAGFEAEYAQSSFDPDTSEDFGAAENRLIRMSGSNSWQGFSLGLGYQSVGEKFEFGGKTATGHKKNNKDPQKKLHQGRESTEAWVSRQFGNLGVKTSATMYQDKTEGSDNVDQFTTHKVGSSLNYMISAWPSIGVTLEYGSGVKASSGDAYGTESGLIDVENVASSLYYSDESWSGTFYVENASGAGTTNTTNLQTYWLGGSYFPISTFTVSPSISYVKEEYPEFDVNTDSFAASMTVNYKPTIHSKFNFVGYSEYSTEKNVEWDMDSEYMYSSLGVNWDSKKKKALIDNWSVELFHDQYTDNLYSENSIGGVGVMLKMQALKSMRAF